MIMACFLIMHFQCLKVSFVLAVISIGFFVPVLVEYLITGLVPKFPTLIACGFLMIASIQSFFAGLTLQTMIQKNRQDFEMNLILVKQNYDLKK